MENSNKQFIWNGINLNSQRMIMDDPCDQAILSIYGSKSMTDLRTMLTNLASNDSAVPETMPTAMRDFIYKELHYNFTEEDITCFQLANAIWQKKGMKFTFVLLFRALPYTYMAEKPANVLKMTKLLIDQPERRVFETAQFVFDIMDNNWWEPNKRGILTALKVRLMHSAMRHLLLTNTEGETWNPDWGKPISQEDLIATNQVFSLEFFKGLSMLKDDLTKEEQKAWFHTWICIGKIMGIQPDLICADVDTAWDLQHHIYEHLFNDKTVAGIPLTKALVSLMVHFHLPEELTLLIMKRMLADEQFPDCFDRMLGPSFKDSYPTLFEKPESEEANIANQQILNSKFRTHVTTYYASLVENQDNYVKPISAQTQSTGILSKITGYLKKEEEKEHLFVTHLKTLHALLHIKNSDLPVQTLEEDAIIAIMNSLGSLMVSVLAVYFREGKNSGFRIPQDLQELWSLS